MVKGQRITKRWKLLGYEMHYIVPRIREKWSPQLGDILCRHRSVLLFPRDPLNSDECPHLNHVGRSGPAVKGVRKSSSSPKFPQS